MLVFQKERFVDIMAELPEIFYKHWYEAVLDKKDRPLKVNWPEYMRAEAGGLLHIITAREEGRLMGYFFVAIQYNLNYDEGLTSYCPGFYLRKECRKGLSAPIKLRNLIIAAEKMLRDLKVQRMYITIKVHLDVSKLLIRMGYAPAELGLTKLL